MFEGCNNLVGGMGSKVGEDYIYEYDQYGNPSSHTCYDDRRSAHIDGGPNNPGLFTQKP